MRKNVKIEIHQNGLSNGKVATVITRSDSINPENFEIFNDIVKILYYLAGHQRGQSGIVLYYNIEKGGESEIERHFFLQQNLCVMGGDKPAQKLMCRHFLK